MVKRKYAEDSVDDLKRAKTLDSNLEMPPQLSEDIANKIKLCDFDIKHFRKELSVKQGQTIALTQFLQVCLNPDSDIDYMMEYLTTGGNSHEILKQVTQENKKNLTLTTPTFHLFHLIILKVQSCLPHMIAITEEACRYFLNTFMSTVEVMVSENSGPRHRKIILKLLTSMVTLNADLGIEVLNQAPLTPKHLQYIVEKANYKEKDNVRTNFVHFMTSFLVDGHLPLIKALLEKQGLLALVFPGLVHDEAEAVLMFLTILKKNIINDNMISKSLKLKTFSHQVLHNLFKVFSWRGPSELNQETRNECKAEIQELVGDIILTLFTSHKFGLYFTDSSLGTTDLNKNPNLYKAVLSLKRPWENDKQCEVLLDIIYLCPDLHRALIAVLEQSFEPLSSPIWERAVTFVIKLLDKLKPENMVPRMTSLNPGQVASIVRFITLPVSLLKSISSNLGTGDQAVSVYCVKVLVKMLTSLKRYLQILELTNFKAGLRELRSRLESFFSKHLPMPSVIVPLIESLMTRTPEPDSCKDYHLPQVEDAECMITLIDLLLLYHELHPSCFETLEGRLDMKVILNYSTNLTSGHAAMLKFKIVSLWITLDSSAISLNNPMFKELFLLMLEVYTSEDGSTWIEAKETVLKFFKNTSIFEGDEEEIHIMLYTLRNAKVQPISIVADVVEYVLTNNKQLTDHIRNQMVHFEISGESSQTSLETLFVDLMANKNSEDCMFLENRIPSSFIVGCIQYIQLNKEVKKHLKHFLSLYIANLLHCNYSPELTEVLIGDSKLDVRSYVASWLGKPRALNDTITTRDATLRNLGLSIIEGENLQLADIFPFLEVNSGEGNNINDIVILEEPYKISPSAVIDSSELIIWAKYLIFCTIRLAKIGKLEEDQHKKNLHYFKVIMDLGKTLHMTDICVTVIENLLKNQHVLHIYSPIDDNKDRSRVLATSFTLDVVEHHVDMLSNKHVLLQPFQQKNYDDLNIVIKIKKDKTINNEHTVRVLQIVGMAHLDNLNILKRILGLDSAMLIKDDKEPSVALEILRVLLAKYSKVIEEELPDDTVRDIMKFYTNILQSYDTNINLTELENTLAEYFQIKPAKAKCISVEEFKFFFKCNSIRKSTAYVASTILQHNECMCNVYKEQLTCPEILARRELTLPLANALMHHKTYLQTNTQLLHYIWSEYRSNILKILEKPNKAGQVYVTNWKFIKKLLTECSVMEDCVRMFGKLHRLETADITHMRLFQALFLRMCLLPEAHRPQYLINYFMAMLNLMTIAIKNDIENDTLKEMASIIYDSMQIAKNVKGFNFIEKEKFKVITDSTVWQHFSKSVLKHSLKLGVSTDSSNNSRATLLYLLTAMTDALYPTGHDDIVTLFDMVTSHSEFLNIMLSRHSYDIKSRLIELLYVLILLNKSVMKKEQIPVYLSAYHAKTSTCDRLILKTLHFYETNGQPVHEYKPYVWGDTAANYYAVRKNRSSSLWGHPTPNQVLNLLEKDVIERTVEAFNVNEELDYGFQLPPNIDGTGSGDGITRLRDRISKNVLENSELIMDNETAVAVLVSEAKHKNNVQDGDLMGVSHRYQCPDDIYDPAFLFPLLSHLLAPGSMASSFKVFRRGLLSIPVMALSARCASMRAAAYHVLHRFWLLLETETKHRNDKLLLTDFMETLRHSLPTAVFPSQQDCAALVNPRLPCIGALYLARALLVATVPHHPLYKPVNNFLIAKQQVDLGTVPDFLSLFHDSDIEASDRRYWILDVIKDGTRTMMDVNVVFKTMCLKMMMDFYSSSLSDKKAKEKILSVLCAIVAVPRAAAILVDGYSLVPWLSLVVRNLRKEEKILITVIVSLLESLLNSLLVISYVRASGGDKEQEEGESLKKMNRLKVDKDIHQEVVFMLNNLSSLEHSFNLDDETVQWIRNMKELCNSRRGKKVLDNIKQDLVLKVEK